MYYRFLSVVTLFFINIGLGIATDVDPNINVTIKTPYVADVPGPMLLGKRLRITGITPPNAFWWNLNLSPGVSQDLSAIDTSREIVLHVSMRFEENCIVRNTRTIENEWGVEERYGRMPLQAGEPFEVVVLCAPGAFEISINGTFFCSFAHRLPWQEARRLDVQHDVELYSVTWDMVDF